MLVLWDFGYSMVFLARDLWLKNYGHSRMTSREKAGNRSCWAVSDFKIFSLVHCPCFLGFDDLFCPEICITLWDCRFFQSFTHIAKWALVYKHSFQIHRFMISRLLLSFKAFTPANTGLDKRSQFPELGSAFKAAFRKACSWFFAKKANEFSEQYPHDTCLTHFVFFLRSHPETFI